MIILKYEHAEAISRTEHCVHQFMGTSMSSRARKEVEHDLSLLKEIRYYIYKLVVNPELNSGNGHCDPGSGG